MTKLEEAAEKWWQENVGDSSDSRDVDISKAFRAAARHIYEEAKKREWLPGNGGYVYMGTLKEICEVGE